MDPKLGVNRYLELHEQPRKVREIKPSEEGAVRANHQVKGRTVALAGGSLAAFLAVGHGVNDVFTSFLPTLLPTLQWSW